jgi:hypothetical protein
VKQKEMTVNIGEIVLEIEAVVDADAIEVRKSETAESEPIRVAKPEKIRTRT